MDIILQTLESVRGRQLREEDVAQREFDNAVTRWEVQQRLIEEERTQVNIKVRGSVSSGRAAPLRFP